MKRLATLFLGIFLSMAVLPLNGWAQQTGADTTATEQPTANEEQEMQEQEPQAKAKKPKKRQKKKKAKKGDDEGFFDKLLFWKEPPVPDSIAPWHQHARMQKSAKDNEYYRFGYTQVDEQWVPVFFLRRFKMMEKQYNHILIIKGQPTRRTNIKGVTVSNLGMEIENQGFDVEMPKFPSVARARKRVDEQESVQLATIQLQLYGFDDVIWLEDKRKDFRDLADTWNVDE